MIFIIWDFREAYGCKKVIIPTIGNRRPEFDYGRRVISIMKQVQTLQSAMGNRNTLISVDGDECMGPPPGNCQLALGPI